MNLAKFLAPSVVTIIIGLAPPLAWSQTNEPGMAGSVPSAPAAASVTAPAERIAPGVTGIPPNTSMPLGHAPGVSADEMKANYLAKKIADAQAHGKDVTAAKSQEAMGNAALRKNRSDEAAWHFKTAFRSIGVTAIGLDQDAGQSNSDNQQLGDTINN
jgi:hypothetical protein